MKLLFATDGKSPATKACDLLVELGDRERLNVTVLSVNGFSTSLEEGGRRDHHYSPEAGRAHALEVIDATVARLRAHGFGVEGKVAEGYPPYQILGEIERSGFEMTLMGSGTSSWLGQVLLGSVATKVLHASPSSVLITHDALREGPARVLYGTDGSSDAELALDTVMALADAARTSVHVACVVRPNLGLGAEAVLSGQKLGRAELRRHADAERVVARATDVLRQAGFTATGDVLVGHPTEQLLKAAEGLGASLVSVGSRGLGALDRAMLGSVSDTVSRYARAVLVGRRTIGGA